MTRPGTTRRQARRAPPRLSIPVPKWFLAVSRVLSLRGRVVLLGGVALVLTSFLLGQQILLRLGTLLVATPLVCVFVVGRARHELHCARMVAPARVTAGEFARVTVRVYNDSTAPSKVLLAEDHLPWASAMPRFVLDRIEPAGDQDFTYATRAKVRGRYPIGPLSVRLADPFGMCQRGRALEGTSDLVVVPNVEPLPMLPLTGDSPGTTDSRPNNMPAAGDDDIRIREYRQGDPLNRIHWGTTARRGELMVRQEEHPRQTRATVLVDVRENAHRGTGPESSVEWAVSACASLSAHLAARGYAVRVLLERSVGQRAGVPSEIPAAPGAEGPLLDALAVLETAPVAPLSQVAKELGRPGAGSLVVAVIGEMTAEEAEDLARRRPAGVTAIAFLLRAHTWDRHTRHAPPTPDHTAVLRSGGWRTVTVEEGDTLASVWRAVLSGSSTPPASEKKGPATPAAPAKPAVATAAAGGGA